VRLYAARSSKAIGRRCSCRPSHTGLHELRRRNRLASASCCETRGMAGIVLLSRFRLVTSICRCPVVNPGAQAG
jgi:hypothetical protein